MKIINYNLGIKRGARLSKEAIYAEVDTEITLTFDCSTKYRKHAFTAIVQSDDKRHELAILNGQAILPSDLIKPQEIKVIVRAELAGEKATQWECEAITIESLEELQNKIATALPEYTALPLKIKEQAAQIATLKAEIKAITDKLDKSYAPLIKDIADRLKKLEEGYDLFKI